MQSPLVGKEIKLILKEDKGYLVEDKPLNLGQLDLSITPLIKSKGFLSPAYLKLVVKKHYTLERKLVVVITDYCTGETDFTMLNPYPMDGLRSVQRVVINDVNTMKLLGLLPAGSAPVYKSSMVITPYTPQPTITQENEEVRETIEDTFMVAIKKLTFGEGAVSFDARIKNYPYTLTFSIANDYIREEYDAIKNYFGNVWNAKNIQVTASIEIVNGYLVSKEATCPQIASIDDSIIGSLKFELISGMVNKKVAPLSKSFLKWKTLLPC